MRRYLLIVMMMVSVMSAARAFGHARLDRAEPKVGSTVEAAPTEVKIVFTEEAVLSGTSVEVLDATGKRVDKEDVHAAGDDKSVLVVSLAKGLAAGKYKVVWKATCAAGHGTKGEFSFTVK